MRIKMYTIDEIADSITMSTKVTYELIGNSYYVGVNNGEKFFPIYKTKEKAEFPELMGKIYDSLSHITPRDRYFTFDEVLPLISEKAAPYAETVDGAYVCGIEHNGTNYMLQTFDRAEDADAYVAELSQTLAYHYKPVDPGWDGEERSLLEGFTFVPNKGMATIYVGKRNRLYLKGGFRAQLGIKPASRILLAFNKKENAFAIVKPNSPAVSDEMRRAGYFVSNKMDVTCARLFRDFDLDKYEGVNFYADTASLSGNVVIFRR